MVRKLEFLLGSSTRSPPGLFSCHDQCFSCVTNRDFKIGWLRTTVKHATAHDQNHVTVHFSRLVLRLRRVVELFRVVATTKNILLAFCRLGNYRISSFCKKKVFNSPALSENEGNMSVVSNFCSDLRTLLIYSNHLKLWLHFYLKL